MRYAMFGLHCLPREAAFLIAALVVVVTLPPWGVSLAEEPRRPRVAEAASSPIAVLDVKLVLERYTAFQRRKAEIAAGIALSETTIRGRKAELDQLAKRLRTLQAGTAEHTETDLQLARQTAELQAQVTRIRTKTQAEQARAYVQAYQDIVRETENLLAESDYQIVVQARSKGEPGEVERGGEGELVDLIREMSQPVVSFAEGADISREIVRRLNGVGQKSAARMRKTPRQ